MNASSNVPCSSSSSPFSSLHLMVHRQSKTSLRNQPNEKKTLKEFHRTKNCKHCRLLSSGFLFLNLNLKSRLKIPCEKARPRVTSFFL